MVVVVTVAVAAVMAVVMMTINTIAVTPTITIILGVYHNRHFFLTAI